ncbi:hypothetical protein KPL71_026797 [Citrus sinensis]|uniref:Uncharacterized protein n=1 Tax=Citrus sinensis TaxID=2711 RepID=A0ACB8I208_CITSI|nr:hypothetical protein KPL71_026797 [Citrus sinensis]
MESLQEVHEVEELDEVENNLEEDIGKCHNIETEREVIDKPKIGILFDNANEMFTYYKTYGKQEGFLVKRRTCKKGSDGIVKYVTFVCGRNGSFENMRSRAAYKHFGDVVTFDTTYLTNKYDMPFDRFVGVNHHEEQERYEKILSAFTEVAGVASGCAESCNMVLDWIKNTLKTLPEKVSSETNQPTAIGQGGRNINVENTTNIFDLTDLSKANTVISKPIQWKDVNLPEEWILEGIAPPAIPKQLEPNTELQNVTQYSDESSPITIRKKIPEWKLTDSNKTIESEHPPFRSITIDHGEPPIEIRASPYKIHIPNDSDINLSSIIQQNNFCNTNLNTIGKQLTRIENQFQKSTITVSSTSPIPSKSDSDKKLKEPIFKPFQVSKTSQRLVHESKSDFAKAIREQLDRIEAASSSSSKVQIAPDTPQSSKIGVLNLDQVSFASSDLEAFTEEPVPKANKIQWDLALPISKSPPDLTIDNRLSALNQARYNASSVYEWNIDGMSEYNILGVLQQMTMAANAYKTQSGTSDKAIAEILIAGFTGQLKGWWDHLLTKLQQLDIFNAIQIDENGAPILDKFNNPIQDAVATLILTISLHFIGDPSHLRDKNAELLHNLRCRKLSEFQDYKTTFFTRLFLRDDANHVTWKEKFLAGLPTLLGEKVRNSIKALYDNRVPYDELTYGELVSFVNKEGLKICQDLKLQRRLKWELRKSKQELGGFSPHLVEFSDSESSMSGDSDPLQVDELLDSDTSASSSSDSDSDSYLKKINVLTKDQEIFLELVKHISDPNLQKEYLDKLLKTMDSNKAETSKVPIVKKNSYDLTEILDKKKTKKSTPSIQDLQKEIKDIKLEINDLKEKQKSDSNTIQLLLQKQLQDNSDKESTPDDDDHIDQKVENIKLKKNPVAWSEEHTKVVRLIKQSVKNIPCLFLANPALPKIVETDASDIGYGGHLQPTIKDIKAQGTFLSQKSKAQALLASAKTEEEYFKAMEQLLSSRSKSSVADSSEDEDDDDDEPTVSLGDENEDDCFGIFSPLKHCK